MGKWIKISTYADRHGISQKTVRDRVADDKLEGKLIKGVVHVYDETLDGDDSAPETQTSPSVMEVLSAENTAKQLDNELKKQRLKNLRQDTLIKKQKQSITKERYRIEFAEGVLDCFTSSFSDWKNTLISMKLNKKQMTAFQSSFKKSLKKFEENLKKYLKQKDEEEEHEKANDHSG